MLSYASVTFRLSRPRHASAVSAFLFVPPEDSLTAKELLCSPVTLDEHGATVEAKLRLYRHSKSLNAPYSYITETRDAHGLYPLPTMNFAPGVAQIDARIVKWRKASPLDLSRLRLLTATRLPGYPASALEEQPPLAAEPAPHG